MHCCNTKRKIACFSTALILIAGLVGAMKCSWMRSHLNNAFQAVKQYNPIK